MSPAAAQVVASESPSVSLARVKHDKKKDKDKDRLRARALSSSNATAKEPSLDGPEDAGPLDSSFLALHLEPLTLSDHPKPTTPLRSAVFPSNYTSF